MNKLEFILASGNAHKAEEFAQLVPDFIKVSKAPSGLDVVEDGEHFRDNALLKAKAFYDKFDMSAIADDSGICVEYLPDELGIHSARFGGDGLDDVGRCKLLLKKLEGVDVKERIAAFVCHLCVYLSPDEIFFFEGRVEGRIGHKREGEHGFGYDPVFLPDGVEGKTLAQIPEWKNKNSHRARAIDHFVKFFEKRNCQNV